MNKQKREWYGENKEEIQEKRKERYKEDAVLAEKAKVRSREWFAANPERAQVRFKKYYESNKEYILKWLREYRHTPQGRAVRHRARATRRELGYKPINEYFEGAHYHHLLIKTETGAVDKDLGLYVPEAIHRKVHHCGNKGTGMAEINLAVLGWYINSTPRENQAPIATKLYEYYLYLNSSQ